MAAEAPGKLYSVQDLRDFTLQAFTKAGVPALDSDGRPTTDTKAAIAGTVMPMAGHKGYAQSFMIDVLSGILTGAAFGPHLGSLYSEFKKPQSIGHLLGALDISRLVPIAEFKRRLAQMCAEVRAAELADWAERIYALPISAPARG